MSLSENVLSKEMGKKMSVFQSVLNYLKSFENWLIVLLSLVVMDSLFTIMGLSYGLQEGNPLHVWAIYNKIIYYPFLVGISVLPLIFIIKYFWENVWWVSWLTLPLYFYITSLSWFTTLLEKVVI